MSTNTNTANHSTKSKICHILVYGRSTDKIPAKTVAQFEMTLLDAPQFDISSTDIRALRSLSLPLNVVEYIMENSLYFGKIIRSYLRGEKYKHSLSVARLAFGIMIDNRLPNPEIGYVAGLLHDIAKLLPIEQQKELVKQYYKKHFKEKNIAEILPEFRLHGYAAIPVIEQNFDLSYFQTFYDVVEAIRYHTSPKAQFGVLGQILYIADRLDPLRGLDNKKMYDLAHKDYKQTFIKLFGEEVKRLKAEGKSMDDADTAAAIKYYLG
jgi:nicotinate-nucleotide adenylyltransferase